MADYGHKETDKRLEALEKRVAAVYKQASEEMKQKLAQWYKDFERLDKQKAALVDAGKLPKADYLAWRKGKMVESGRLKALVDTLTEDFVNSDKIAMQIVRGDLTDVYALNANYAAYKIEQDTGVDLSWTLYDHSTVERMIREDPDVLPLPSVDIPLDERWNRQHLNNAITQGILQGESIPHIADRLQRILGMDHTAAVRSARTATTAAESSGRIDAFKYAESLGIHLKQMWRATLDGKTRHAHRLLDGQMVDVGEPFQVDGYEIWFPGDPSAPGYLIYNCRCAVVSVDKFHDPNAPRASKLGDISYDDWKAGKEVKPTNIWGITQANTGSPVDNKLSSGIIEKKEYKKFESGHSANDFFYYDDDKRGLLAKKKSEYSQWVKNLESGSLRVISDYSTDGYDDINKYWRKVGDWQNIDADKVKYQTDLIDKAISTFNLKDNITAYRGIDIDTVIQLFPSAGELEDIVGQTFADQSFSSTSVVRSIAEKFAEQNGVDGVLLELSIPKGKGRGAYLDAVSAFGEAVIGEEQAEYEFLLKRNAKFEIYEIDKNGPIPVLKGRWLE